MRRICLYFLSLLALILASQAAAIGPTRLLRDINPGADSNPRDFFDFNGRVGFKAEDSSGLIRVWMTDGTTSNTVRLLNAENDYYLQDPFNHFGPFVVVGDHFYFIAKGEAQSGLAELFLFRSDGTPEGTLKITPAITLTRWNNDLLFAWQGSVSSSTELYIVRQPDSTPEEIAEIDSSFYSFVREQDGDFFTFVCFAGSGKFALWSSDGTSAGTTVLANPFLGHTYARDGKKLYLVMADPADTRTGTFWETDGTPEGTRQVLEGSIAPTATGSTPLTRLGDKLLFFATDAIYEKTENGFEKVTDSLYDIVRVIPPADGSEYVFYLTTQTSWRTDGTSAGTREISGAILPHHQEMVNTGGNLYYSLFSSVGSELGFVDGDMAHGFILKDIVPGLNGSFPLYFATAGHQATFTADHPDYGREWWMTDGLERNTVRLTDINPGPGDSVPGNSKPFYHAPSGKLYLRADHPDYGIEPWVLQLEGLPATMWNLY